MKYKLIQKYPGSPKLGTEIIKSTIYGASSTKVVHTYMIKGDETFELNNPKDYPEFWEPVIEKDYEILSYICKNNIIWRENKCHTNFYINNSSNINIDLIKLSRDLNAKIYSVKRLSDGEF